MATHGRGHFNSILALLRIFGNERRAIKNSRWAARSKCALMRNAQMRIVLVAAYRINSIFDFVVFFFISLEPPDYYTAHL